VTVFVSLEQVLALHELQSRRYGGAKGVRDRGALEAAVGRPQATFGGEDLYPDHAGKAAALLHSLVMNHPFVDGNKRVGAHAALVFLDANGLDQDFGAPALTELVLAVARGEMSAEAVAIWLRQRTHVRER
jgi:death on curing protein